MIKVLLVDDEPGVCELLVRLIHWDELGMVHIGCAYDGIEAASTIGLQKPDIVITDIRLPGMTGLELVEKEQGPDAPSFIVISGYREFEYARRAVKFGVEDYLLKPLQEDDLNNVLRRLAAKIRAARQQQSQHRNMEQEFEERTAVLRVNELRRLASNPDYSLDETYFHFEPGEFFVLGFHVAFTRMGTCEDAQPDLDAGEMILNNAYHQVHKLFAPQAFDIEMALLAPRGFVLVNHAPGRHTSGAEKREQLKTILREINIHYENMRFTIGTGRPEPRERLGEAMRSAQQCLAARLAFDTGVLIDSRKVEKLPELPACLPTQADKKAFGRAAANLDKEALAACVDKLLDGFEAARPRECAELFAIAGELLDILRGTLAEMGYLNSGGQSAHPLCEEGLDGLVDNCGSIAQLRGTLKSLIHREMELCHELRGQWNSEPVNIAKSYVEANIDKQVTLEEIAERAFVSAGYFSNLFKKQTGMNFSDYVIQQRVEKAKEYLRQKQYSVSEIAGMVGYSDPRHFSKVFHKVTGVKPNVYRKFHS